MGPTATGKTDAAAFLTEQFPCEIISVDSSLVYSHMDIGTAKPDSEFLKKYPHHLVDIRHPNDTYSVADFYQDTSLLIKDITERGKVPVLAGGTMFYYNVLEQGLADLPEANPKLREELTQQAQEQGWPALHERLSLLDSASAQRIDAHDAQRIQRALEIVLLSGKTVTQHNENKKPPVPNPMVKTALVLSDRTFLHERIEQRFDIMLESGLEKEVSQLLDMGVDPETTAMKMIGYRQMLDFLKGDLTYDEMRLQGIAATRQLAKRQLTWLRNQSNLTWWVDKGIKEKDFTHLARYLEYKLNFLSYN